MRDLQIGISPPEMMEMHPPTAATMRQRIYDAMRNSPLIMNIMQVSDQEGWSGEDRYVALAYHALVQLEDLNQRHLEWVRRTPNPSKEPK